MQIVLAKESHVSKILEVWKELMDYHRDLDSFFSRRKNGHLNFKKYVKNLINSNDALVLVAIEEEAIVGYSIAKIEFYPPVFKHRIYGLINDLAVRKTHRRKGIGEHMLTEMYKWFESRGVNRVELRVAVKNQIGYSFWKKHGFKEYMHILYLKKNKI